MQLFVGDAAGLDRDESALAVDAAGIAEGVEDQSSADQFEVGLQHSGTKGFQTHTKVLAADWPRLQQSQGSRGAVSHSGEQSRKRFPARDRLPFPDERPAESTLYTRPMQKRVRTEKPRARMDIRDVARRAGVSISTVSRVTNGKGTVNREMADRVWRAVRELNYQPDPQARALVSGRSHIIGLMVTEITNPFFPELIQRFEQFAVESGYEVLLASTPNDAASIAMSVRRMLQRKVDGVAVMMFGREAPILEELATHAVPLVVMDGAPTFPKIDAVRVNYDEGIRQAVAHLVGLGHQAIAFVSGPLEQASARLRREAFEKAMRACHLKIAGGPVDRRETIRSRAAWPR